VTGNQAEERVADGSLPQLNRGGTQAENPEGARGPETDEPGDRLAWRQADAASNGEQTPGGAAPGIGRGNPASYRRETPGGDEGRRARLRRRRRRPQEGKGQERTWPAEGGIPRGVAKDRAEGSKP
jgi:hypothetical protein